MKLISLLGEILLSLEYTLPFCSRWISHGFTDSPCVPLSAAVQFSARLGFLTLGRRCINRCRRIVGHDVVVFEVFGYVIVLEK